MSAEPETIPTSTDASTKAHHISLKDRTITRDNISSSVSSQDPTSDAECSDSEVQASSQSSKDRLARTTTNSVRDNLQQRITRQKYARYQSYRYDPHPDDAGPSNSRQPEGLLERGRAKAAEVLKRKKTLGKGEERDAVLDILYENQRGSFLFGIPRYSSNSLLQFDPKPWQNADFRTSAVDIRNAQVPDPSWQWAWKSWYVDMSRDVDEEGWEYSFAFAPQFNWHGNHPWFHSFVRRRRWLRRRVRKDTVHKTKEKAHELAPDYFTIHTKILSAGSQTERHNPLYHREEEKLEELEMNDIGTLTKYISKARIDREKLVAVRKFVDGGGEDIHYLADRMPEIMSTFIYQSSRRQLLAELLQHHETTTAKQADLAKHSHDGDDHAQSNHAMQQRKADNLLKAIQAAEAQIQQLEYWSDIKDVAQEDKNVYSTWDKQKWQGVSDHEKLRAKQAAEAGAAKLNDKPETRSKHTKDSSRETDSSAYTTASSVAPSKRPGINRPGSDIVREDPDDGLERFVTASEGPVSSIKAKQIRDKAARGKKREKALQLDGLEEHDDEELHTVSAEDAVLPPP